MTSRHRGTASAHSIFRPNSPLRARHRAPSRIDVTATEECVYLDWAATTPPDPEILEEARRRALSSWANPSSAHAPGRKARSELEEARTRFGQACGLRTGGIVFTASGTEADQIPLLAALRARYAGLKTSSRIIVSDIEHAAIHAQAEVLARMGLAVDFLKPDRDGRIRPEDAAQALRKDTALVAIMAVNNETGAVQDIPAIGRALADAAAAQGRKPPFFHCDAVQALGKVPFVLSDMAKSGVTSAAFSAHKLRGPKGSGALWFSTPIEALALGGGQEGGIRSGTESIQGAWGLTLAAERAKAGFEAHRTAALELEAALLSGAASIPGVQVVPESRTAGDPRWSPYIVSLAFPGLSGEVLARALSDLGIAISTGSACSEAGRSGKPGGGAGHGARGGKGRRILDAMGLPPELALASVRVSFGSASTRSDIDRFLDAASTLYRRLKT
ncbi:MAG: cysteine desulfurase family protein [Rectinemataceae bacterium]